MRIEFDVDGSPVEFRWNNWTGKTDLLVAAETIHLTDALDPQAVMFSYSLIRTWHCRIAEHEVEVEKTRPLFFAGLRPNKFTVKVDGQMVAQRRGL